MVIITTTKNYWHGAPLLDDAPFEIDNYPIQIIITSPTLVKESYSSLKLIISQNQLKFELISNCTTCN